MATVTINTELVRLKVDYKFGDETATDVDEIIAECVLAPDTGLREAIAKAISTASDGYASAHIDYDVAADAVLAVLAERGMR